MRYLHLFTIAALLVAGCTTPATQDDIALRDTSEKIINSHTTPAEGMLLVRLADGAELPSFSDLAGIDVQCKSIFPKSSKGASSSLDRWYLLSFDTRANVTDVANSIAASDAVEAIEYECRVSAPNYQSLPMPAQRRETTRSTNYPFDDPELPWQWHYYNDGSIDQSVAGADINLLNAWKYTTGDKRVVVAVIDGGIMHTHPDLESNMWVNEAEKNGAEGVDDDNNGYIDDVYGYNFVESKGQISPNEHGTHVAGTISAVNNNGTAGCGIAGGTGKGDGVRLMSVQIFRTNDEGRTEGCYAHQIAEAIRYAADNGAAICNNSWCYESYHYTSDSEYEKNNSLVKQAIDYFEQNAGMDGVMEGGLAIFAAGNASHHTADYPGAYHKNIAVAAMAGNYTVSYYSNYGPGCNISAPGGDSTYGTVMCISSTSMNEWGYGYLQGTSMAAPHVTGCAALALSYAIEKGYTITSDELRSLIVTSAHDINPYQTGTKLFFGNDGSWYDVDLEPYKNQLGSGYIDAHMLLMQMDGTPCLYISTGNESSESLDAYFGTGSESLKYTDVEISDEVRTSLGITQTPSIEDGCLKIECSKPGVGRIKVKAIIGGTAIGGADAVGGMEIEREFEIVVRKSVAQNDGWL